MNSQWNKINNQNDIDDLLNLYAGFHDSCIKDLHYTSGIYIDDKKNMVGNLQAELLVIFQSQWIASNLELKFQKLRRLNLVGYQDNYFNDILDCHLSFHGESIVWADSSEFDVNNPDHGCSLKEPMISFVVADVLMWRIAE